MAAGAFRAAFAYAKQGYARSPNCASGRSKGISAVSPAAASAPAFSSATRRTKSPQPSPPFPGAPRDQLALRACRRGGVRDLLDEVGRGGPLQRTAALRTLRKPLVGGGERARKLPPAGGARPPGAVLPEALGQQQGLDGTQAERVTDDVLAVRRQPGLALPDLLHEARHELLLAHEVEVAKLVLGLRHELPRALHLVRVPGVEGGGDDLLGDLVVEVAILEELLLGIARATDEDALDPLDLRQEGLLGDARDLLEELPHLDLDVALEASRGLASHPVLPHDAGLHVLDDLDALPAEEAEGELAPVQEDEPEDLLLREHGVQRLGEELGVAAVEERGHGLRRLEDES